MKKELILFILIIVSIYSVSALEVGLLEPTPAQTVDGDTVSFKCRALTDGISETLTGGSMTLYFKHDSRPWADGGSQAFSQSSEETITFGPTVFVGGSALSFEWNCLATNNNSNEAFRDTNSTFTLTMVGAIVNNPPNLTSVIANKTWAEDEENTQIDLDNFFSDLDGDTLSYSVSTSPSNMAASISAGGIVTLTPTANWNGQTTVVFQADDGINTTQTNTVYLTVTPVNDAPQNQSNTISNVSITKNSAKTIDLTDYFTDPDGDSLTFTTNTLSNINISIDEDDDEARLTPATDWTGTEYLDLTATDTSNVSLTINDIPLVVSGSNSNSSDNEIPIISNYTPADALITVNVGNTQLFSIEKSDGDGDTLIVTWVMDSIDIVAQDIDKYTYKPTTTGTHTLIVTVSDGEDSDSNSWTITVKGESTNTSTSTTTTNQTQAASATTTEEEVSTAVCGNGNCESDEDEYQCCLDCGCPDEFTCNPTTETCMKTVDTTNRNLILILVVGVFALGGAVAVILYYKKKQEEEIFGKDAKKDTFTPPPKDGKAKKDDKPANDKPLIKDTAQTQQPIQTPEEGDKKSGKLAQTQTLFKKEPKKNKGVMVSNPDNLVKEDDQPDRKKVFVKDLNPLVDYIENRISQKKKRPEIKAELLKVGWTAEQIKKAFKEIIKRKSRKSAKKFSARLKSRFK